MKSICTNAHANVEIKNELEQLRSGLLDYYRIDRIRDYSFREAGERAKEVYSEFLQDLIYYICHNVCDKEFIRKIVPNILKDPLFFYKNSRNEVTVWVDPKEQSTALISLCRLGLSENLYSLLRLAASVFGGKTRPEFKRLLSQLDKDLFSSLNTACNGGHTDIVRSLLESADEAFGGKATLEFKAFISHQDKDLFSPLKSACKVGHTDIVR